MNMLKYEPQKSHIRSQQAADLYNENRHQLSLGALFWVSDAVTYSTRMDD